MKQRSKIHYAWWTLVALSIIVGIGKGALNNTAGLFLTSITEDLGIGMGQLSLYFSVSAVVTMVFLPVGGKLMAKYDTRFILSIGILLQAGAFALFGLMSSVWGWYILAVPLAMGGVFITVIAGPVIINQWFKKSNGLALGVLSAVGGGVGAIAQPITAGLIDGFGWRSAYIIIGVASILIVVPIAMLLIKRSPQAHGVQSYGADEVATGQENQQATEEIGISMAVAKKSTALYALMLFFFLITSIASFSMHIPTYLTNQGFDITFAGNVMGTYMLGILFGSLLLGYLVDKIGSKYTAIFAMGSGVVAISMLLFSGSNTAIITFAVGLFGLISSSIGIVAPALTSTIFGKKAYSQIYSTASLGLAISSIVALPAYGFVYDATGSYISVLYALIVMLVINIGCVFIAFNDKKKMVEKGFWTE
ncbi:Major Facilitator Superfamily protein [Bhargavaea beijingensis]|uniref:Major Facilitator Superfamily protein n=1 Tax=Bhargavaea beijingensis TaxID=426756 RepID=A0A1G6Y107_9BACL|nr:MFS transporter [Bhargavaea beijingensis]SDD84099.1 Major Facilitator Superfamily protein [Bhargavaea beijingensis]